MSDLEGIDWRAFRDAIMCPPQPRLDAALGVVRELMAERGMSRPPRGEASGFVAEAWERMAARLGGDYLLEGSGRVGRRFLLARPPTTIYYDSGGVAAPRAPKPEDAPGDGLLLDAPAYLTDAVALMACDPGALLTAEELIREACRRLAPWGYLEPRLIAWAHIDDRWPGVPDWRTPFDVPAESAKRAQHDRTDRIAVFNAMGLPYYADRSDVELAPAGYAQRMAAGVGEGWVEWRRSVRDGSRVGLGPAYLGPIPQDLPEAVVRKRFADVADPLDPLLVFWGSGFVPIDLRYDVMILGVTLPGTIESLIGPPPPPPGLPRPRRGRRK